MTVAIVVAAVIAVIVVLVAVWGPSGVVPSGASAPPSSEPSASAPSADPSASPDDPAEADPVPPAVPDVPTVDVGETAAVIEGLTAQITLVEAVDGTARGPGEVAGPSVRVSVRFTNSTDAEVSLVTTVVSAYYGNELTPAPELREPGGMPFPPSVAPGQSAVGVFLFTIPESERGNVTVMVDHSVEVEPVLFRGDITTLIR